MTAAFLIVTPNTALRASLREEVCALLSGLNDGKDATSEQCQLVIALALAQITEALDRPAADGIVFVRAIAR
jgi:hypothetical protein